ncbi:efflux RND transporter permease subunit [Sphingobacterium sp. lm-10]|uniref:efflux RND transporter permease subunit n=1 Tax=Sphingobacterium sp. lm-10 TaxID=2944904 RepID=UPI0024C347B0|nr:efflux RND transporter permease subunit [Sphingobacterium sp. lm-10]
MIVSKVFIRRPVTAMVISILLCIVGVIALVSLPISQYPDVAPPTVTVQASFTGADAKTVEETVTTPLEAEINGVPGMIYMQSNSTADGNCLITVTFEVGTDVDIATVEVQNRVSIAEPILPEAVRQLGITTRTASQDILMMISLISPNDTRDVNFLSNYANIYLRDAIQRVEGVGDVLIFGQEFSMRIWLDASKLSSLSLTPQDVENAIRDQNLRVRWARGCTTATGIAGAGISSDHRQQSERSRRF